VFPTLPFVLAWKSIRHYLLPTIYVFVARFVGFFVSRALCLACKACGCYEFVDKDFPEEKAMRGLATSKVKCARVSSSTLEDCQWKRASELKPPVGMKRMQLFNGIEPQDIAQGQLGDCWLLASFAALAEHPSAVRRLFVNHEINDRGKYQVRLYNPVKGKFQIITIDDYLPVDSGGTPIFAKPRGGEIWVCLLEKAFAKFWPEIYPDGDRVGYESIISNAMTFAFHVMTGDNTFWITPYQNPDQKLSKDELFRLLEQECARGALISVAAHTSGDKLQGLVTPHAYTVLDAQRAGTVMGLGLDKGYEMIKLRNPWGAGGEWKGDWSDGSSKWSEHPTMASWLGHEDKNDGVFWMSMDDFYDIWNFIEMCDRTTKDDFCLDMHEELGFCGPVAGCVGGCASFWCLCRGARTVYLGHATRDQLEAPPAGLNCCAAVG
jgi:calpain-15